MITKTVNMPFPFNKTDFVVLDVTISQTEEETIWRRDLYLVDQAAPNGMVLIKRGPPYINRKSEVHFSPQRYWPNEDSAV